MADIPDFVPQKHRKLLCRWVRAVCEEEQISEGRLQADVAKWLKVMPSKSAMQDIRWFSNDSTLKRMRRLQESAGARRNHELRSLWEYFRADHRYAKHFPVAANERESNVPPPSARAGLLGFALQNFFRAGPRTIHIHTNERIGALLAGRFVMYRQDFELASRRSSQPKLIRASRVQIWRAGDDVLISEEQHFPAYGSPKRPAHRQLNQGVLFPYGAYVIGLMGVEEALSFKCLVINDILSHAEPGNVPTDDFKGKMLVASDRALFPSALFFCRRSRGGDEDPHGIFEFDDIDEDIVGYLTTPTFRQDVEAVF